MKEDERLKELYSYKILDTPSEKVLDEIAQIASAICDTPSALITLLDEDRQWFKSKIGIDITETPRKDSFCQYTLLKPREVLVVENPAQDERFKDNPYVTGDPNIRFYAGAPLQTPSGHVLGNLCVIDSNPHQITEKQKQALLLLAGQVMDFLNSRKLLLEQNSQIELNNERLKKLTDHLPGAIYQFELSPDGNISLPFISKGITEFHPNLTPERLKNNSLEALYEVIHPEDLPSFQESVQKTLKNPVNWLQEFRIVTPDGKVHWLVGKSKVERTVEGTIIWYGIFREITQKKEYITTLEQILFDISHVMRRPIANLKGLVSILEDSLNNEVIRTEFIGHIKTVTNELDNYINNLNRVYSELQLNVNHNNKENVIPEE